MAPRPTVIGTQGYRRGLASLSVVKERLFRVHRNVPGTCIADAANDRAELCLVGLIRSSPTQGLQVQTLKPVARSRLPALLTSASAEFLLGVLVALRLASEFPCGNPPTHHSPLITAAK
jgi:hypothetical protein